jgi:hypothetical protein
LVSGRSDLQIVRHISHRAQHKVLRSAYERIAAAMAVVEVVDSLSVEGAPDEELFTLLSRVLSTLDDETIRPTWCPRPSTCDCWPTTAPNPSSTVASVAPRRDRSVKL